MLDCQTRLFADVGILANSIYDYLNVRQQYPEALSETLYHPDYKHGFISVGRKYFIYNCRDSEYNVYNGNFLAILIEYKTGYIYRGTLNLRNNLSMPEI